MGKTILAMAVASTLPCATSAFAADADFEQRLQQTERRLQYLENRVQDQDKVILEKDRQIAQLQERGERTSTGAGPSVEIHGVVEVEGVRAEDYAGDSSSDLALATAEFGIAAKINDWVSGEIVLLYEEDDTDLEVDAATVSIAPPDGPWNLTAGRFYVPFGTYDTNLVSDPLTLEIGETRETALQLGFNSGGFESAVYFFNGDNKKDNGADDEIDNWGAALGYAMEQESLTLATRLSYINDIGDSDNLQDTLGTNDVDDHVPGIALSGNLSTGPFTVIGEYVAATDEFQPGELAFNGAGAEPKAWNIEVGYGFRVMGKEATFAIGYQETEEALALELPEKRLAAAISVGILENTALSLEWAHDEDYGIADGGTGEEADTLTAQLAVEF